MQMRESLTVVLERNSTLSGEFTTEPYEAAWAAEARWFVRTLERSATGVRMAIATQVSPDGLHWCDLEPSHEVADNLATWSSTGFGGWLRLKGTIGSDPADGEVDASAKVIIYLALKS